MTESREYRNLNNYLNKEGTTLKIHEYQAKQIMKMYGINVPNGSPAFSP